MMNNKIKHLPNGDFQVIYDAEEIHSDKGYEVDDLEKAEEFDKKRNYEWDNWKPIKDLR